MIDPTFLRLVALVAVFLVSVAATCSGPQPKDLKAESRDRLTPSGRISYEILPRVDERRRGSLPEIVRGEAPLEGAESPEGPAPDAEFTLEVSGEIASVEGEDDVDVNGDQFVDLGPVVNGPGRVQTNVDDLRAHVALRPGGRFMDILSVEGLFGVGFESTRVRIEQGSISAEDQDPRAGLLLGGRVAVRPMPLIDLNLQATILLARAISTDLEAGAQLNPTRHLGVYGGYRRWTYDENTIVDGGSDGDFRFSGPTVGVSFGF